MTRFIHVVRHISHTNELFDDIYQQHKKSLYHVLFIQYVKHILYHDTIENNRLH